MAARIPGGSLLRTAAGIRPRQHRRRARARTGPVAPWAARHRCPEWRPVRAAGPRGDDALFAGAAGSRAGRSGLACRRQRSGASRCPRAQVRSDRHGALCARSRYRGAEGGIFPCLGAQLRKLPGRGGLSGAGAALRSRRMDEREPVAVCPRHVRRAGPARRGAKAPAHDRCHGGARWPAGHGLGRDAILRRLCR